jgi:DNA primase
MAVIPDDVKNEIRARADIVAVIGQHVQLRKAGRNHKGLCPFHHEKSPSFNVNDERQMFYCFGCHKKGDVFTFVMEYEGKSFVEAAQYLAARFGVTIPERRESPADRRQRSERERMLETNKLAAGFFRDVLLHPERGEPGRRYLRERGISDQTAEAFQLGYAPDDWHALGEFLSARRVPVDIPTKLGLIVKQPSAGGYYDRFRDRLMCPVVMPGGEIAGFSGRRLKSGDDAKAGAKYINSPESPVYKKSSLLFGLHLARNGFRSRGRAVLVEGNFDVVSLHQAGFEETVAPLGTALTEQQVELLRRLAGEVVLLYDGDDAGRAATLKSLETLVAADVAVRIAVLPTGQDPDSVVARGGAEELGALIDRAQPAFEYFIHEVWSRSAPSADRRATALSEAARLIHKVANPTKRDLITGTLAAAMGIAPDVVQRALSRGDASRGAPSQHERGPRAPRSQEADRARRTPPPPSEELQILAILDDHPELMASAEEHDVFSLLTDARLRDMYCAARQGSPMLSAAPDDISPLLAKHVFAGSFATVTDPTHCLLEAVAQLKRSRTHRQLEEMQRRVEDAQRRGDVPLARQLVREILTIKRQVD